MIDRVAGEQFVTAVKSPRAFPWTSSRSLEQATEGPGGSAPTTWPFSDEFGDCSRVIAPICWSQLVTLAGDRAHAARIVEQNAVWVDEACLTEDVSLRAAYLSNGRVLA